MLLAAGTLLPRPGAARAAGLPCPLVYSHDEAVLFRDAAGAPPRRLGAGRQPALSDDALAAPDLSEITTTPLARFAGGRSGAFTSADRFSVRPGTGEIVYSMPTPGTTLFQKKVPDVSSALFLFDPATGRSRRLTPEDLTAFGPVFSPDGGTVFFSGYRDKQAGSAKPFRLWAMPLGQPARALGPGEDPAPPAAPARP